MLRMLSVLLFVESSFGSQSYNLSCTPTDKDVKQTYVISVRPKDSVILEYADPVGSRVRPTSIWRIEEKLSSSREEKVFEGFRIHTTRANFNEIRVNMRFGFPTKITIKSQASTPQVTMVNCVPL